MASSWIIERAASDGTTRYLVRYRAGGAEARQCYAGSFRRKSDALARRRWVDGELAAMRVPDLSALEQEPRRAPTLRETAERWLTSRIDVADHTRLQHRSDVNRAGELLDRRIDQVTAADVAALVAELAKRKQRETVRKTVMALAMVFDHAGIEPNPARDKRTVRLPRGERHGDQASDRRITSQAVHDAPPVPLPAAAARARRDGDAARRARGPRRGATSTSSAAAGASRRPSRRRGRPAG